MTLLRVLFVVPFATLLAQEPAPAPASAARHDRIELHGGEVLQGRIVQEVGNYIEVELRPGCVVGFRTSQVAAIHRGVADESAKEPLVAAIANRDEWFLLHDGSGQSIGSLHLTVGADSKGITQVVEEWEFAHGGKQSQFTSIARMDASRRPLDCYFRERVIENARAGTPLDPMATQVRIQKERIVQAKVEGDRLVVTRLTPTDRGERSVPWQHDATFALLARELPLPASGNGIIAALVFDPASEELRTAHYGAPRQRIVELGGSHRIVEESVEQTSDGRNTTWRDAATGALRREVSGPALVALRCDMQAAKNLVGVQRAPSPFCAEPARTFGLWSPNPAWSASTLDHAVSLRMPMHDAVVTLSRLDSLDSTASLDAAASAVERWSQLTHPKMAVTSRAERSLRGTRAVQIETSGGAGLEERRARMVIVAGDDGFLVLRCSAPARSWDELDADFESMASRIERTAAAVAALDGKKPEGLDLAAPAVEPAPAGLPAVDAMPATATPQRSASEATAPVQKGRVLVPPQDGDRR